MGETHRAHRKLDEKLHFVGSECPPTTKDLLRLNNMRFCPFAQRTCMVLYHKNIPHEVVNINLKHKPEWFLDSFPLGMVPALEVNEKKLCESVICNDYLDEVYPGPKLTPDDPYVKATHRVHMEHWNKVNSFDLKVIFGPEEGREEGLVCMEKRLVYFEKILEGKFFGGEIVSMLDINMWPHMARYKQLEEGFGYVAMPKGVFPKLEGWIERMMELPVVKEAIPSNQEAIEFLKGYQSGHPNYDIGL